jgi:hypothetical protein
LDLSPREDVEELAYNKPDLTASSSASANHVELTSEEAPIKFDEYLEMMS